MEVLREKLINLIEVMGITSEEVIKASTDLDKLIIRYYKEKKYALELEHIG